MSSAARTLSLVLGLALVVAGEAAAQLPAVTPEQAAAGLRVVRAAFPAELSLQRGDSTDVPVTFFDAQDQPVEGTLAFLYTQGGQLAPPISAAREGKFRIHGGAPGSTTALIFVRVPDDSGGFRGTTGIKQVGSLPVTVADYPVASIEIDPPRYTAYAGTSYKISARAMTSHGAQHTSAAVTWRSEAPSVASITPGGVVSPARPGTATLVASADGVSARYRLEVQANPVRQLEVAPRSATTRTGDVVHLTVRALDGRGRAVPGLALSYSTYGMDSAGAEVFEDGTFVAENPGAYRVVVSSGSLASDAVIEATRRPSATPVEVVGRGVRTKVATSDLWVFTGKDGRDYAYTGTHAQGGGQRMFAWDVTDPAHVTLTDSVVVDARVVNDVKVNADASWAIITREGASNRKNGIVVLDLAQPAHPKVIAELTEGMTGGMHNTWINGNVVYAVNDGRSGMDIVDLSNPAQPTHVGFYELHPGESGKTLHDVWSDGQYAYLSYWDDGLVILDVGAGTHGGTPTQPTFVSQIAYGQGNTHVAWRERNYVFVGDEIFGCQECTNGPRGYIHVMDVSDIDHPKEVAKFEVPEAGTHNIWVEDGLLYIAYYQGGLRIVDVSGELRGDLYRQGRQVGWIPTVAGPDEALTPNSPLAWGPQPFKGNIFVSDMNSGLWVVKHERPKTIVP